MVIFATSAQSRSGYSGRVLELLIAEVASLRHELDVVHVEIYRDSTHEALSPTVDNWGVPGEPWLFALDGTGRIVGRLDGACDRTEIRDLLSGVVR